ncbi:MAG: MG2 domain-containing protein, partial [Planctomycetota bacterium]
LLAAALLGLIFGEGTGRSLSRTALNSAIERTRVFVELADEERSRIRVDFGAEMVAGDLLTSTEPLPENALQLDPDVPFVATWQSASVLRLNLLSPLPRAQMFGLTLNRSLRSLAGEVLPSGTVFRFNTPGPAVVDALPATGPVAEKRWFRVVFDMKVERKTLENALSIHPEVKSVEVLEEAVPGLGGQHTLLVGIGPGKSGDLLDAVTVRIDASLQAALGNVPMGTDWSGEVVFSAPLLLEDVHSSRRGIEVECSRDLPLPAPGTIEVEPHVPFQVVRHYSGLALVGDFPPGETIDVVFKQGFPGDGVYRLPHDDRRTVTIQDLPSALRFRGRGQVLSSLARPELEIEGVNLESYTLGISRAYPNNIFHLLRKQGRRDLCSPEISRQFKVAAEKNVRFLHRVDLSELLGEEPRGIYRITISNHEEGLYPQERLVQITDLGVTLRTAPDAVVCHVRSLAGGAPIEGAEVRIFTPTNQVLVEGQTSADGIARLPFTPTVEDRVPFMAEVRSGADHTWIDLGGFRVELADETAAGRSYLAAGESEAYVYLDRGVVRPGETAHATVLVRDGLGRAPSGLALEARWFDARERRRLTQPVILSGSGLLALELETGLSDPTGLWRLELVDSKEHRILGRSGFLVEAFVPDRLELEARVAAPLALGGTGELELEANWLAGGPASERPYWIQARFDRARFSAGGFEGYSFGMDEPGSPPGAFPPIRGMLDADGRARVRFSVPEAASGSQSLAARIQIEVEDPSGRPVRTTLAAAVAPRDFVIGLNVSDRLARVALLSPDGRKQAGERQVSLELIHHTWDFVFEETAGRFGWRTELNSVSLGRVDTAVKGGMAEVDLGEFRTPESGWLTVVASCEGRTAEQTVGERPLPPDRLRVRAPKNQVAPGAIATCNVDAPFGGSALVTLEGLGLHSAKLVELEPGLNQVELEIPANATQPNLHAVFTLSRPQAAKGAVPPFLLVGSAAIPLVHQARRLDVALEMPESVEPESEVEILVRAEGAADATLSLVDVGILRLTRHGDAAPEQYFNGIRRLDGRGADTGTSLLDGAQFDPEALTGGDDFSDSPQLLEDGTSPQILSVALFRAPLAFDAAGEARVRLRLPPYEGRLRAVVTAANSTSLGAAAKDLKVAAPLSVTLALPRVLAQGDGVNAIAVIRNLSEEAGDVRIELAGRHLELPATPGSSRLAPGETLRLVLPISTQEALGAGSLQLTATLGRRTRTVEAPFILRPAARFERQRIGLIAHGMAEFEFPGRWVEDTLEARLVLDPRPDLQLAGPLKALLDYPHGCAEQTTSQCIALLAARDLLPRILPTDGGERETDPFLTGGIQRLHSLQLGNGGFALWPSMKSESMLATVYATDFLLSAREAGARLPDGMLDRASGRLFAHLSRGVDPAYGIWAAEVLGRAGRPAASWLNRYETAARTVEDRSRLALGLARLGEIDRARDLLVEADPKEEATREQGGLLRSTLRSRALLLRALMAVDPADDRILPLVESLLRRALEPDLMTTNEQAYCLLALSEWFTTHAPKDQPVEARVTLGSLALDIQRAGTVPLDVRAGRRLRIESERPLYCFVEFEGYRTDPEPVSLGGVRVRRRVFDSETGAEFVGSPSYERGKVYDVMLELESDDPLENGLITDILPGGFELENTRLGALAQERQDLSRPDHLEFRDDRVLLYVSSSGLDVQRFGYRMRAVFSGEFATLPVMVEALYDPGRRAVSGQPGRVTIR